MDSFAWSQLSAHAQCAWIHVVRVYSGSNNGRLAVSVRDLADKLHLSKDTAARALQELVTYGFVEIAKASSFSRKRLATEYRLTHLPCDATGELPSKTFIKIKPNGAAHSLTTGTIGPPNGGFHSVTTGTHRRISGTP